MPDLIHAHSAVWAGVAAAELKRRYGLPYVITEHSSAYARELFKAWQTPYLRTAFRQADYATAVSGALATSVKSYVGTARITVIPNMVDTDYFHLPPERKKETPFRFLVVAFLTANKGIDILIRAFAKVLEQHPDLLLDIGGDGTQREALETLTRLLDISRSVRFLGELSRKQVRNAMWQANCFVLPSYVETFGIVLVEAMSTGLPVVATHCGGPTGFVISEVGRLVEPGNVDKLAVAMEAVYMNPAQYNATSSRDYAVEHFHSDTVTQTLLDVYTRVIQVNQNGNKE